MLGTWLFLDLALLFKKGWRRSLLPAFPLSMSRYTHNATYTKRVKRRWRLNILLRRQLTKRNPARAALYLRVICLWMVLNRAYWNQPQQVTHFIQANITRYGRLHLQQKSSDINYSIVQGGKMFHAHLACKQIHDYLGAYRYFISEVHIVIYSCD